MNLWDKGTSVDALMQEFTVGNDRAMDARLARWDVVGSIAHVSMLAEVGLLGKEEGECFGMLFVPFKYFREARATV